MRVVVTGANGHIGSNVVRVLVEQGHSVVALVRPRADRRGIEGLSLEVREGDILERSSLASVLDGAEVVIHTAAPHRNFASDPSELIRPAVDGTRNVLDACAKANVRRMVLTSTAATVGFATHSTQPLDESHQMREASSPYIRAKLEQEKLALADDRLEVVVLNPSGVIGPGDYRITPAMRAFAGLLQGDPAFMALSVTDVRDVALAHARAAERGKPRERYLVTGEVLGPKELAATFTKAVGVGPKVMTPPRLLVRGIAWWQERKARATGSDAPITRAMLDDAWGRHLAYDSTKSRQHLEMTYRPAVDAIRDSASWLLDRGALKASVAKRVRSSLRAAQ